MTKTDAKNTTPKKRIRSRNWCFTDHGCNDWKKMYDDNSDIIRYIMWSKEVGTKTNKEHHQGWIQMVNPKDMRPLKRLFDAYYTGIHLEPCKGTELQNENYCNKQNKPVTLGEYKVQGQRSDLESIKKTLDKGGTMYDIAQDHFGDYVRYHKGFEKYQEMVTKRASKDFRHVQVEIHKGETGTGKTRSCCVGDHFMIHGDSMQWWDGYDGETTLVIDEYANQIALTKLLGIIDGYQMRLPIKGGFTYAKWTTVKITTNLDTLHEKAKYEHLLALDRRVTKIINY